MAKQIKTTGILNNNKEMQELISVLNDMVKEGLVEIIETSGETRYRLTKKQNAVSSGEAARKAWATRRRMSAELKDKRVSAARKAVETRRRNMALQKEAVSR